MRDRCCGCAHRGQRIQARVGSTAAHEGRAKPGSRHGGHQRLGGAQASPTRNGTYRWKAPPIGQAVAGHAAAVETVLAALAREDPREGVKVVPPKPERERRQGCQRSVPWAASVDKIPGPVTNPRIGVNGIRRSGDTGVRAHPLPRSRGGPQSPSLRTRCKPRGQCREPASTGNRSREFGKQTSDERIGGACPSGRRKTQRRERCLA